MSVGSVGEVMGASSSTRVFGGTGVEVMVRA